MVKRARGSVRPGQRRPIDRRPAAPEAGKPASAPKPIGLSDAELERAAQLEAQLLADERAAEAARTRAKQRTATRDLVGNGTLAITAEEEYAYVARDIKRITSVASLLLGILAVLFVLTDVVKVIRIN